MIASDVTVAHDRAASEALSRTGRYNQISFSPVYKRHLSPLFECDKYRYSHYGAASLYATRGHPLAGRRSLAWETIVYYDI